MVSRPSVEPQSPVDFHVSFITKSFELPRRFPLKNELLSVLAKLWDLDRDGYLSDSEIDLLYQDLAVENEADRTISKSVNGKAAPVEVATWALGNQYLSDHIAMAEEIGHICLGLKPVESKIELRTVR